MNFGNPNRPDIFWQMEESVAGMSEACRALGTPVTGGNVSLYNESDGTAIRPTLVIGMLGVLDSVEHATGIAASGDRVFLAGAGTPKLDGSSYLANIHGKVAGRPDAPDLEAERALHKFLRDAIAAGLVAAAHDVSHGGIAVTLAEMCVAGKTGMTVDSVTDIGRGNPAPTDAETRHDVMLFGECPGRVVVTCSANAVAKLGEIASKHSMPIAELGTIGGERLVIGPFIDVAVRELREARARTLPALFDARRAAKSGERA
jgi:phosphoribosylformylglycinamidine synthase subunit PurL